MARWGRFGGRRSMYGKYTLPDGFKEHLTAAFKEMRKLGLMAKQNFSCCGSCAGYELATNFGAACEKNPSKLETILGSVFYHRQTTANINDASQESFFLQFGQLTHNKEDKTTIESKLSTVEVGKIVVDTLMKHGISATWDGDEHTAIEIHKKLLTPV